MIEGLARQGRVVHTAVQGRLFVVRTSVGDSSISQHPSIIINAPDDDDDDFPPSMTALRLASPCIVARLLLFKKPVQSSRTRRLTVSFPPSVLNSLPRSRSRNSMTEQARGAGGGHIGQRMSAVHQFTWFGDAGRWKLQCCLPFPLRSITLRDEISDTLPAKSVAAAELSSLRAIASEKLWT